MKAIEVEFSKFFKEQRSGRHDIWVSWFYLSISLLEDLISSRAAAGGCQDEMAFRSDYADPWRESRLVED